MFASPLIAAASSDHATLMQRLDISPAQYGSRLSDVDYWRPYVELVCAGSDIELNTIASGTPGSFPAFIVNRTHVVKLFGRHFDGLRCWRTEVDVSAVLESMMLPIPVSAVIAAGVLSDAPAWRYLILRYIEGESFGRARGQLDRSQHIRLAHRLGAFLRQVHEADVRDGDALRLNWDDWTSFVNAQRRGLVERHRGWGALPDRLIRQLDDYVGGYRVEDHAMPALVHADLHEEHVLGAVDAGNEWRISGVIDWGDARIGERFYELPALHLGLFHGDTTMLAAFLDAYAWPQYRGDAFVRRAMTMTLLHEFNVLQRVGISADVESLDQLADRIWRV